MAFITIHLSSPPAVSKLCLMLTLQSRFGDECAVFDLRDMYMTKDPLNSLDERVAAAQLECVSSVKLPVKAVVFVGMIVQYDAVIDGFQMMSTGAALGVIASADCRLFLRVSAIEQFKHYLAVLGAIEDPIYWENISTNKCRTATSTEFIQEVQRLQDWHTERGYTCMELSGCISAIATAVTSRNGLNDD